MGKRMATRSESHKNKQQENLLKGVTSTIEKLVESPVLQQLGKNVGNKMGMPANPLAEAKTAAAQNQLSNPLETPYAFTCNKCRTSHTFSARDLSLISERGGMWMCPSKNCAETYKLKDYDKKG